MRGGVVGKGKVGGGEKALEKGEVVEGRGSKKKEDRRERVEERRKKSEEREDRTDKRKGSCISLIWENKTTKRSRPKV